MALHGSSSSALRAAHGIALVLCALACGREHPQRLQDGRTFTFDEASGVLPALPDLPSDRYWGVLDGAGYQIEVPKTWNGMLVMYAHGYAGTLKALSVSPPPIRRYLIEHEYAWAASSYSKNYYDVRAGIEDTNHLALQFKRLVGEHGRMLDEPRRRFVIGESMGGHVAAAAIEREVLQTAVHKVRYDGAMPMCGVVGDIAHFNVCAAYQYGAEKLAGLGPSRSPSDFERIRTQLMAALFVSYPSATTAAGDEFRMMVQDLSGGARPYFKLSFEARESQDFIWSIFGGDDTIDGILALPVVDTQDVVYQLDDDPALSTEERIFNRDVYRAKAASNANAPRPRGLRWIPLVNGELTGPVVTLHTLGDLVAPFKMEQVYRQRALAHGNGDKLVQRAIRSVGHCTFTLAEQVAAFDALVRWVLRGLQPEGDDVLDPAQRMAADYGCNFTLNTFTDAELGSLAEARSGGPACP